MVCTPTVTSLDGPMYCSDLTLALDGNCGQMIPEGRPGFSDFQVSVLFEFSLNYI